MSEQRFAILGDLERAIMDVVWTQGEVTVRGVLGALQRSRSSAYTTIMTVMNRLVEKGMLRRLHDDASYTYRAVVSKNEFLHRSSQQIIRRFVRDYGDVAIAHFVDVIDDVDPKKLAALRRRLQPRP